MKKIITMAIAAMFSAVTFAQEVSERVMRIQTIDGVTTPLLLDKVQDISFEEITPLSMDIEVSNITETSMDIEFPMPSGCKYWLMCIQKEELTGTDLEVRQAIKEKYNDKFSESKFLRIPNFEAGTTYYIYALMYDQDGVVAGLSKTSATTLNTQQQANDEFSIDVTDVTKTTATVSFTPKDNAMTYYYFVVSEADRAKMIEKYGDIQTADLEYLQYSAEQADYGLSEYLSYILVSGPKTKDTRDIIQSNLEPGTKYYAYCYGMNNDGSFTTGMYEKEFTTEAVAPSNNVINCEVVRTYTDGCDVKVTTTNDDPYMIDAQPKEVWENFLSAANGDKTLAAKQILSRSYGGYADNFTKKGNQEYKVEVGSADTDYVLIIYGFDAAITTDVQTVEFRTLAQ